MATEQNHATTSRNLAGEFPQPVSPWENRGLLWAEVVATAAFAIWLLIGGLVPEEIARVEAGAGAQTAPSTISISVAATEMKP